MPVNILDYLRSTRLDRKLVIADELFAEDGGRMVFKDAEVLSSGALRVTQIDADGNEVTQDSPEPGEGGRADRLSRIASASYDAAAHRIIFSFPDPQPTQFALGDQVAFIGPSNLDDDAESLTLHDSISDVALQDIDAEPIGAVDLRAGRIYTALRTASQWRIEQPVKLFQVLVPQQVVVDITAPQVHALDTHYIEIVPAPGAGKVIEVFTWWLELSGTGELDSSTGAGEYDEANPASVNFGNMILGYVRPDAPDTRPLSSEQLNFVDGWPAGIIGEPNGVYGLRAPGQPLVDNRPLYFGYLPLTGNFYSESAFDDWINTLDRTLRITLNYRIHDVAPSS